MTFVRSGFTRDVRRAFWPIAAYLVIAVVLAILMTGSFTATRGGILYPLDDTYIHLALARTLAETGVWGLLPDRPAAASSSPLWSVLLATAAKLFPHMDRQAFSWTPLIFNLVAGLGLVLFWRERLKAVRWPNLMTLLLVVIMPLPCIMLIGMEHVLHTLLATALAWSGARAVEQDLPPTKAQLTSIALLSAVAVASRYETMALVGALAVLAAWQRRWSLIPATVLPALAVVLGFGWLWVHNGGWILPNSFLIKTDIAKEGGALVNVFKHVLKEGPTAAGAMMAVLVAALVGMWVPLRRARIPERSLLLLGIACTVGQFIFGQIGWLYRYEAWLISLDGLALLLAGAVLTRGRERLFAAVALALLVICLPRTARSVVRTVQAAHDRVWEHFGPTEALGPLAGAPLLVNDVGVISYYGSVRAIDIYGLADNEVLRLKQEGWLSPGEVRSLAQRLNAQMGQFQLCWPEVSSRLPAGWVLVEVWQGPRNVIFRDLTVAYMAEPGASQKLHDVLLRAPLPAGVQRFDASSELVTAYNTSEDKAQAAAKMCDQQTMLPPRVGF